MPYGRRRLHSRYPRRTSTRARGPSRSTRRFKGRRSSHRRVRTRWQKAVVNTRPTKFTYVDDHFSDSCLSNSYTCRSFRGNSCFDPDFTGVGVQPYAWDNFTGASGLFTMYNCLASKISVYFSNTTNNTRLRVLIVPSRTDAANLPYSDPSDISAMPYCRQLVYNAMDGSRGTKLSAYCSTRKLFPDFNTKDNTFSSLYSASPATQWYWCIFIWDEDSSAADLVFDFKIKYYCIMTRNSNMNES